MEEIDNFEEDSAVSDTVDEFDLDSDDLRYLFDMSESEKTDLHEILEARGLMFNLEDWAVGF